MNATNRLWHVAAALGLALLAVTLTTFYVTNYKRHVQQSEAHVTVLVAAKDIPADTPGTQILSQHLLTKETVSRRAVVPGAISSPQQIQKLIATQPVYVGEQVTTRRFGTPSQRGVRAQISGNQRAFQLAGDTNQLLAGTLREGDHADVVASWTYPEGSQFHVSRVVLRGLLVLAAPAAPGKVSSGIAPTSQNLSTQLALTDAQSQKLQWVLANAQWHLEVRPPAGSADSPGSVDTSGTLVADGVSRSTLNRQLSTPAGGH
jgi:Flp pilus assembly protein CpaB